MYSGGIPRYVFNHLYVAPTCLLIEIYGKELRKFVPGLLDLNVYSGLLELKGKSGRVRHLCLTQFL